MEFDDIVSEASETHYGCISDRTITNPLSNPTESFKRYLAWLQETKTILLLA